jgi:hypothetical protein
MHTSWTKEYADEIVRLFRHTLETGESYETAERTGYRIDWNVTEYYEWRIDRTLSRPNSAPNGGPNSAHMSPRGTRGFESTPLRHRVLLCLQSAAGYRFVLTRWRRELNSNCRATS